MKEKIFIRTFGCSLNQSDSEQMAGLLTKAGFTITQKPEAADLIIFNSCTVKSPAENALFKEISKWKYKKLVIAGCIPQTDKNKLKEYSLIGTKNLHQIIGVVQETLDGNLIQRLTIQGNPDLTLPRIRRNKHIGIIPISRGCLGSCTFCKTKAARGNLYSYPPKAIISLAKEYLADGVNELWLTSQDCGCYGFDINTDLAELLKRLTGLPGDFKIRIGMANPDHILKILTRLIHSYKNKKVFQFLHLPIQSGNDHILTAMKRNYSAKEFKTIISAFRKEIPDITISTDIICGFPGETEEQFQDSLNLISWLKPLVLNISRFWPREKTPAAKMKPQLVSRIIKERSRKLHQLFRDLGKKENKKELGRIKEVLIEEKIKNGFVGRDENYRPIIIKENVELGQTMKVKIVDCSAIDLRGKLIKLS